MDRHHHEQARSCYRAARVTLQQSPTGLITWQLMVKAADAHWANYQPVAEGEIRNHPQLTSTAQVTRVLVNALDAHLGSLSGPS